MDEDRTPGIRIIERFFLLFGILFFVVGIIVIMYEPADLVIVLAGMVSLLLFWVTRLVEFLGRKMGPEHWTQAVPERFRVAYVVWFFFIAVGPPLLAAALAGIIMESPGTYLVSTVFILGIGFAFAAFMTIDRALVMRRKRREESGELPRKKTRLITIIQAFFMLMGLSGVIFALLADDPDSLPIGLFIAGGGFAAFLVCLLIEKLVPQRGELNWKSWTHAVYGYCIPFGVFSLGLGIARLVMESNRTIAPGSRKPPGSLSTGPFIMAGLCFGAVVVAFVIERLRKRSNS